MCDGNKGVGDRNQMGQGRPEEKPCSPSGDLLEQRVPGGRQPSKWEGGDKLIAVHQAASMDQSLRGTWQSMPRSKYVRTALPAVTLLSFPVASLIDMDLLTCDPVLAALEPKCLVVVMRCAFF